MSEYTISIDRVLIGAPQYWKNFYEYMCIKYGDFDEKDVAKELEKYNCALDFDIKYGIITFESEEDFLYFKLKWS